MNPWELHPALVHFPIAFLFGAIVVDLYAWSRVRSGLERVVLGLLISGVSTGVLAALAGVLAYFTLPTHTSAAHEMMSRHIWLQTTSISLFLGATLIRWRSGNMSSVLLARGIGLVAGAILLWGSSVGGEMVYRGGTGIDPALLKQTDKQHTQGKSDHKAPDSQKNEAPPTNADDNNVRQP